MFNFFWLHGLLIELEFRQTESTSFYADNTIVIHIFADFDFQERTKHIEVIFHSIRDACDDKLISLPHVSISFRFQIFLPRRFASMS